VEDSFNADLRKKEMECLIAYKDALKDEESMLKQRAKVDWLSEGDANTKFFHKTVKGNLNRNRIEYVDDMNGVKFSGQHAPGPDGFSSKFFKSAWSIIGNEVCIAVGDFFNNDRLLKEVNATIIALVPKSISPQKVLDFRPISCCNVLYKIITKIIANRIKGSLGVLVDESQNAFIPSR
nr:hypothetical protein [Tanacetum cinerariifolium]